MYLSAQGNKWQKQVEADKNLFFIPSFWISKSSQWFTTFSLLASILLPIFNPFKITTIPDKLKYAH